jgi:NADH-quinone oxidoreductase subunit M
LLSIVSAWEVIKVQVREFMIAFLILETLMVGIFCALDFIVFYVFFEGVLVPMFLIIGIWGADNRVYSAFKFFLYTLLGSVLMLLAILAIYLQTGSTDIEYALNHAGVFSAGLQRWLWLAFFASFAIKVPMWPVHTWLPDAHVEAPTAGSVILAGILLKLGGYGFVRFSLPMFPLASHYFTPLIFVLSAIAVIYTSLVALAQTDMKKVIAYSSVAHMGFVTMGTFAVTQEAMQGAVIQMLSHGLVSGALFLCVGVLYDRLHTHEIARFGGLVERMPAYAFVFMVFTLAAIGLPGTSGFVGEFLILLGTFRVSTLESVLAATALFLAPAYMLYLYRRVIFGTLTRADLRNILDLSPREKVIFAPLLVLVLWMGIYPTSFVRPIRGSVNHIVEQVTAATEAAGLRRASLP